MLVLLNKIINSDLPFYFFPKMSKHLIQFLRMGEEESISQRDMCHFNYKMN